MKLQACLPPTTPQVVFKQRGIYLIQGDPGSFRSVTLTEEIGSASPNGFAATPLGLMFVSENGVYLLERLDSQAKLTHVSKPIDKKFGVKKYTSKT